MNYQLLPDLPDGVKSDVIKRLPDCASIPIATGNRDYQEYLAWLAEGNEPLPADES
jgi:hypothetical protein